MTIEPRCGSCRWFVNKECWRNPPVPFPMPSMSALSREPQITLLGLRPPTPESGRCAHWDARAEA